MMTENETDKDYLTGKRAKIVAMIFLGLMILPVCYALFKELRLSKQAKEKAATNAAAPAKP
ncbi:hypothetical protein GCM10023093_13280 [Nemorincola caseinilytica]|uniref:Uncharacterized protein n=1 Tax=Nemorincola caseinilytica TaxID=2054315 RepID=A0ABP8NEG3_9BACT